MANTIQIKHGSGAPSSSVLASNELGFDTTNNVLYIGKGSSVLRLAPFNGGTVSSNISISPTGSGQIYLNDGTSGGKLYLGFGSGHQNHGVYSYGYAPTSSTWTENGIWMLYRNSSGAVILNGNALNDSDGHQINSTYLKLAGGTLNAGAQIIRAGKGSSWYNGRDYAIFRANSINGYSAFLSLKTTNGSWEIGSYDASGSYDKLAFNYTPDSSYSSGTNTGTVHVYINSSGVLEGTVTRATGDGDGNTISSTYLKLSGGSMSGWVWHSGEVGDIYDTARYASSGGGWSYVPIRFRSSALDKVFFAIGAYGTNNALNYGFIGPSYSYSDIANIRIYPSGAVYMGNGGLQIGDGTNTSEISCKVSGKAGLIYMYSASSTTGNRGIYLSQGAGTRAAKYVMYNDSNNENHFYGLIDQIYYGSSAPTARTGQVWLKPIS